MLSFPPLSKASGATIIAKAMPIRALPTRDIFIVFSTSALPN
jgi:hypothetical protein